MEYQNRCTTRTEIQSLLHYQAEVLGVSFRTLRAFGSMKVGHGIQRSRVRFLVNTENACLMHLQIWLVSEEVPQKNPSGRKAPDPGFPFEEVLGGSGGHSK